MRLPFESVEHEYMPIPIMRIFVPIISERVDLAQAELFFAAVDKSMTPWDKDVGCRNTNVPATRTSALETCGAVFALIPPTQEWNAMLVHAILYIHKAGKLTQICRTINTNFK